MNPSRHIVITQGETMKHIRRFAAVFMMLFAATAFAAEGEYTVLNPPQPTSSGKKIEVLEFFFYGCPHCYHLQSELNKWERTMPRDVQLDFVPVAFAPSAEPMAYTYYTLQAMGLRKKMHDKLYEAWNVDHQYLTSTDDIADYVAKNGVDRQRFLAFYNSFSVQAEVKNSKQMMHTYQIEGTPTLVVEGKYAISGLQPEDTIRVLNEVIEMARREHGKH
jgi:thiol:disulfide interchange protein DsbA